MSIEKSVEASKNLFDFSQTKSDSNTDNTLIFEEVSRELEEFLLRENDNADSTDHVFEFLAEISNQVQEEFDELLGQDTEKKQFLKSLSKIFALLINTKDNTSSIVLEGIRTVFFIEIFYTKIKHRNT